MMDICGKCDTGIRIGGDLCEKCGGHYCHKCSSEIRPDNIGRVNIDGKHFHGTCKPMMLDEKGNRSIFDDVDA